MLFLVSIFLSLQLHRHAVVVVNFVSIFKTIVLVIDRNFVMNSSLLLKDTIVTRCRPILHIFFKSNSSLPVVDDKYSFTRDRNALASLITSMESLEPLLFCYNLSDNSAGIFADYLDLKITCLSMLKTCGLIYQKKDNEIIVVSIGMEQWISFLSRYEFLKGLSPRIL